MPSNEYGYLSGFAFRVAQVMNRMKWKQKSALVRRHYDSIISSLKECRNSDDIKSVLALNDNDSSLASVRRLALRLYLRYANEYLRTPVSRTSFANRRTSSYLKIPDRTAIGFLNSLRSDLLNRYLSYGNKSVANLKFRKDYLKLRFKLNGAIRLSSMCTIIDNWAGPAKFFAAYMFKKKMGRLNHKGKLAKLINYSIRSNPYK